MKHVFMNRALTDNVWNMPEKKYIAYRRKADSAPNSADRGMNDQDFTRISNGLVHAMRWSASYVAVASSIFFFRNFAKSKKTTFTKL